MSGVKWLVSLSALAALAAGCSSDAPRPRTEQRQAAVRTATSESAASDPTSKAKLAKIAAFLEQAEFIGRVGGQFGLRDVQYTSPNDAVAGFENPRSGDVVVATTDDNWAHASRLLIKREFAEVVSYVPLGRGAIAIKAGSQFSGMSSPPFVLYPSGEVKPLQVAPPRTPDADSDLLEINRYDFFHAIGAPVQFLAPDDSTVLASLWGADVEAGEIFPLVDSPPGDLREHIPGRDGAVVSVAGYKGADKVWRFETSTDGGHAWRRTDVRLPLGRKRILPNAFASRHAIGPGHLQALAITDWLVDMPLHLRELWRTHDEKKFRRVPVPGDQMPFAGMAFASDGALLLAEVDDAECLISSPVCNRTGKIWRLAPEGSGIKLLSGAPTLFGPHLSVALKAGGGVIVAQTGYRKLAVSTDGYTWSEVTPGG
jgi:hypothetical protein